MEPLPKGANFVRAKTLWEIGLHIAGNPATPYGGNRDMVITVGSGSGAAFRPWLRLATGSAILAEDVVKGGVELAFVNPSALLTQAYRGVGLFKSPLPVRIVAVYPSWDRFAFMVHPRTGIRSLADIKAKRYPLRVSVREDPTHSTHVLIEQAFALHGFTLKDIETWGGKLVTCGGPSDARRRLEPLARGELDAVLDEGIKVWLDEALAAGLLPIELTPAEFEAMGQLGWRKVALPKARFPRLAHDLDALDFSGWPIYGSASLPDEVAYNVCGALAAREAEVPWEKGTGTSALHMLHESEATPMDVPLHPGAERWYREHAAKA
jgi:TRAP-type uncharacterized transport system substrate-binding protein